MAGVPKNQINDIYFYATEEHVQGKFLRFMANRHNIILMENRNLKNSILKLSKVLRQGKSIMIFPEGTRSADCHILRFHRGAFYLAEQLGLDIIPVFIKGFGDVLPKKGFSLHRGNMSVEVMSRISREDCGGYREMTKKLHAMYVDKNNEAKSVNVIM
jgi:1-acyl-sn-glycerol-3-phosphate acyltransferase